MQTFMPFPDFKKSLSCLDNKRLGKQRVETWMILNIDKYPKWKNHPAALMWKDYTKALILYYNCSLWLWEQRGFKNIKLQKIDTNNFYYEVPFWLDHKDFHLSHQSNLVRKNPNHYRKFFPNVPDNLAYIWPVRVYD